MVKEEGFKPAGRGRLAWAPSAPGLESRAEGPEGGNKGPWPDTVSGRTARRVSWG